MSSKRNKRIKRIRPFYIKLPCEKSPCLVAKKGRAGLAGRVPVPLIRTLIRGGCELSLAIISSPWSLISLSSLFSRGGHVAWFSQRARERPTFEEPVR
jgi:hypothetical protein